MKKIASDRPDGAPKYIAEGVNHSNHKYRTEKLSIDSLAFATRVHYQQYYL